MMQDLPGIMYAVWIAIFTLFGIAIWIIAVFTPRDPDYNPPIYIDEFDEYEGQTQNEQGE